MSGRDSSADLLLSAWAVEDVLEDVFSVRLRKALDPLDEDDYLLIVSRLSKALRGVVKADEAEAMRKAVETLNVDWATMSASARDRVVTAARSAVGSAAGVLPKVSAVLEKSAAQIIPGAKDHVVRKYGLDIAASLSKDDERTAKWLRETNMAYVTDEYRRRSDIVGQRAREIVAHGLERGRGSDEISQALRKELSEGLKGRSASYWDMIANVYANQARTRTQIFAFEEAGIEYWRWSASLTEQSCDVCRFMDGKVFSVEVSAAQFREQHKLKDPEGIKDAQPWLHTGARDDGSRYLFFSQGGQRHHVADVEESAVGVKDAPGKYSGSIDDKVLQAAGVTCPAHGRCRCDILAFGGISPARVVTTMVTTPVDALPRSVPPAEARVREEIAGDLALAKNRRDMDRLKKIVESGKDVRGTEVSSGEKTWQIVDSKTRLAAFDVARVVEGSLRKRAGVAVAETDRALQEAWAASSRGAGGSTIRATLRKVGLASDGGAAGNSVADSERLTLQTEDAVRARYEATQAVLSRLGVKEITVYRGLGKEQASLLAAKIGDTVDLPVWEAASWSISAADASDFARFTGGAVVEMRVPAEQVYSSWHSERLFVNEREVVVLRRGAVAQAKVVQSWQ